MKFAVDMVTIMEELVSVTLDLIILVPLALIANLDSLEKMEHVFDHLVVQQTLVDVRYQCQLLLSAFLSELAVTYKELFHATVRQTILEISVNIVLKVLLIWQEVVLLIVFLLVNTEPALSLKLESLEFVNVKETSKDPLVMIVNLDG